MESDVQASCTRIPPRKLMPRITRRIADGSLLKLIKQTLTVGAYVKGPVAPTKGGGRKAPRSPRWTATCPCTLGINGGRVEALRPSVVRPSPATPMMPSC